MRNSRIRYLLTIWVILFVSIFTCNAQQIDTVYMNKIASSFKQITNLPQEKVYLHTDKPYYFVGDTIWLKAYLVNAITHFSGNGSQYVYVELINRKDKVLQRIKIQQDKDLFASYLTLPKTLEAGDYYLRAYTHWMLNEDSSFYFSKNLKILASQSSFMYPEIRYEQKGKKRTAIITFKRPDNGVYAGNYVHYMVRTKTHENKFRQQQTNKNGEIQIDIPEKEEIAGDILNSSGDTITHFKSVYAGMGSFMLPVSMGEKYKAIVSTTEGIKKRILITRTRSE